MFIALDIKITRIRRYAFVIYKVCKKNQLNLHIFEFQDVYKYLPENRKLSPDSKIKAEEYIRVKSDPKLISKALAKDGKVVTAKDVSNIQMNLKQTDCNDLADLEKLLNEKYGESKKCQRFLVIAKHEQF